MCQANANKQVVALSDEELERVKKNDILNYALNNLNISMDEKRKDSKLSLKQLMDKYGLPTSLVQSYSSVISQPKSTDPSVNINYICPKYWDVRTDLPVHPRDIYKYVDDIIPPGEKKGKIDKYIFNRTGSQWTFLQDDIFKKQIYDILIKNKYKIDMKSLSLEWDKFKKLIDSLDIDDKTSEQIDKIYQKIVNLIEPRWMPPKNNKGDSKYPCCYKPKPGQQKPDNIVAKQTSVKDIPFSKLSPCNPGRFCHVHPKLQKLFNHDDDIKESNLGGFIINGVEQDNNSLIRSLIVIDETYKNKINALYKPNDYIKEVLIKNLNTDPYYNMVKMGDGYIVQLFKPDKYSKNYIDSFIDLINNDDDSYYEKLCLVDEFHKIKKHFEGFKKSKNIVDEFINRTNEYHNPHMIIMIYNIIISRCNYIDYLNSDEIKDYKYILPLVNLIYDNKNIFIFENNDNNINLRLQLFKYDLNRTAVSMIYKNGNNYEPIVYYNKSSQIRLQILILHPIIQILLNIRILLFKAYTIN